jgi:hypothetical protein
VKPIAYLIFAFLLINASAAQNLLSPGIKLSYRFGDRGGFVGGIDVSAVRWTDHGYFGFVIACDEVHGTVNFHVGIEGGVGVLGICVGPVVSSKDGTLDYGLRVTPYAGAIIVPFYNFQMMQRSPNEHDVGVFLKFPVPLFDAKIGRLGG